MRAATGERGTVAVLMAVVLVVVLGCTALAVDLGYLFLTQAELQSGADAAALAGVGGLLKDPYMARYQAVEYAAHNQAASETISLLPQEVTLGNWDFETRTFEPSLNEWNANSVRVDARRVKDRYEPNPLKLFFAGAMGIPEADVSTASVAVRTFAGTYPRGGKAFPIVTTEEVFYNALANAGGDPDGDFSVDIAFITIPGVGENAGWTNLTDEFPVSIPVVIRLINGEDPIPEVRVGDMIALKNGDEIPLYRALTRYIGETAYIIITENVENYNRLAEIRGFAKIRVRAVIRPPAPKQDQNARIEATLLSGGVVDSDPGGRKNFGLTSCHPILVR